MKWPKGKYNGERISGFKFSFAVHLLWWNWMPIIKFNFGEPYFIWLCFSLRGYIEYE